MAISQTERKRRSDDALRKVAEGKLGLNPFGGKPSRLRTQLAIKLANELGELSTRRAISDVGLATLVQLVRIVREMNDEQILQAFAILERVEILLNRPQAEQWGEVLEEALS